MFCLSCLLLACLSLTACQPGQSAPTQAADPSKSPVGEWRGSTTRFQSDSRSCPRPSLLTVVVWDDRFEFRWDVNTRLNVAIEADGNVHAEAAGVSLTGKRDGNRMVGDATNGSCGLHFTLNKVEG